MKRKGSELNEPQNTNQFPPQRIVRLLSSRDGPQKLDHKLRWTFAGLLAKRKQTMKAKRKRHSAAFKAKVGFEALVGLKTVSQLAREYGVHPTQVTQWRATIRDHMPELFEPGQPGTEDQEQLIAQLHQKIGQLTVDLDWLKKKSKQLGL
jgi:transposase-like protein